jgi:hypothetical protein
MTFWGLSDIAWSALTAIGTLTLALATAAAIFVTLAIARTDRMRDDARRLQERERDALQRAELERVYQAERVEREDSEARQVTVSMSVNKSARQIPMTRDSWGHYSSPSTKRSHEITVSAPVDYPLKHVEAQLVFTNKKGNVIATVPTAYSFEPPVQDGSLGRTYYRSWADPGVGQVADPIVRFTDRRGNLYYVFKQQTWRSPGPDTSWEYIARLLNQWAGAEPDPDHAQTQL